MLELDLQNLELGLNRQTIVLAALVALSLGVLYLASVVAKRASGLNQRYYQKKWQEILILSKLPTGFQLSVIEADKLVDQALKRCNYRGKTMGERLVSAGKALKDQDAIWRAHKLRNRLVH